MTTQITTKDDAVMEAAQKIIAMADGEEDGAKAQYLSLRACFFSEKEALRLSNVSNARLESWRLDDPVFYVVEVERLKEFQEAHYMTALRIQTVRNLRLILEKDREVLVKWMEDKELTKFEQSYICKLRTQYSFEQLLRHDGKGNGTGDFSQFILNLKTQVNVNEGEPTVLIDGDPVHNGD